ncbi:unnamed protein product [Closterium sp. Yama58-4]|nr:unnamed protein product [Closterium sp. Yama58-4]
MYDVRNRNSYTCNPLFHTLQAAEAQESLEEESMAAVRSNVAEEIRSARPDCSPDQVAVLVDEEMATLQEMWERELNVLLDKISEAQECLDTVPGIDLPAVYAFIEKHTSKAARTAAWKERSHWITDPKRDAAKAEARRQREAWRRAEARAAERKQSKRAGKRKRGEGEEGDESEEESEEGEEEDEDEDEEDEEDWVRAAEKVLAHTRPIAETSRGLAPVGASGYLEKLLRDCEETMVGEATKAAADALQADVTTAPDAAAGAAEGVDAESKGDGTAGGASEQQKGADGAPAGVGGQRANALRAAATASMLKTWDVYDSAVSKAAAALELNAKVEEIAEPKMTDVKEAVAVVEEGKKGLTSQQIASMVKIGDGDDAKKIKQARRRTYESWHVVGVVTLAGAGSATALSEPAVRIHPFLSECLKDHQVEGVRFMWQNCIHSMALVQSGDPGFGCILAHSMGLGKTLQVISFVHTVLNQFHAHGLRTVLIVAPVNVLHNWKEEFRRWMPVVGSGAAARGGGGVGGGKGGGEGVGGVRGGPATWSGPKSGQEEQREEVDIPVYLLDDAGRTNAERARQLRRWKEGGGVMLIGYQAFRMLCLGTHVQKETLRHTFRSCLQVCWEGAYGGMLRGLRYEHAFSALRRLETCAEGDAATHLQIMPAGMLEWEVLFRGLAGLSVGGCVVCTLVGFDPGPDLLVCDEAHTIKNDKADTTVALKCVRTKRRIALTGSPLQNNLTEYYCMVDFVREGTLGTPHEFKNRFENPIINGQRSDSDKSDVRLMRERSYVLANLLKGFVQRRSADVVSHELPDRFVYVVAEEEEAIRQGGLGVSGKLTIALDILRQAAAVGDKVLFFSQSLLTLDLLELLLADMHDPVGAAGGVGAKWTAGVHWYRIDGSVSAARRQTIVNRFNEPRSNRQARCVLISTRAGSVGINLVAANRVVLLDGSWNPAHDLQAMFRVWRYGQTKKVFVYRLLAAGTMEEKIYNRQVVKEGLAARVVDEQQVVRHFTDRDLDGLFSLDDEPSHAPHTHAPHAPPHASSQTGPQAEKHAEQPHGGVKEGGAQQQKGEKEGEGKKGGAGPKHGQGGGIGEGKEGEIADAIMRKILSDHKDRWIVRWHEHEPLLREVEHELSKEEQETAMKSYCDAEDKETMENTKMLYLGCTYQPGQFILVPPLGVPGLGTGGLGGGFGGAAGLGKGAMGQIGHFARVLRLLRSIAMAVPAHLHALPPLPHPSALSSPSRKWRALGVPQSTLPLSRRVHDFLSGEPARRSGNTHGEWDGSAQRGFREGGRRAGGRESIVAAIGASSGGSTAPSRGQGSGVPHSNHSSSSSESDSDSLPASRQSSSLSSSSSPASASASSANSASARHRLRGLRADDIRHPLDRQNTALLRAIPGLNDLGRVLLGPVQEQILVLENLGSGVLVSPQQLPSLHALMEDAAATLDMPSPPDLYVRQSPVPNAYTLAINGQKPFVVVHTALLDLLSPIEVQAVLAHELGHLKCEHGLWLTFANLLALGAASSLPGFLGTMLARGLEDQLLRWLRAAELTCDRAALVVVRDPRVVVSVLMKLAGGSTSGGGSGWGVARAGGGPGGNDWGWAGMGGARAGSSVGAAGAGEMEGGGTRSSWWAEELSVDAFLAQARSYDEAANSGPLAWYLRNAQTRQLAHPLPVLRAREVDRWARSPEFKVLMGRGNVASAGMVGASKGTGAGGGRTAGSSVEASGNGTSAPTARLAATPAASAASDAPSSGATPLLPLRSGACGRPLSLVDTAFSAPSLRESAQPSSASARGRRGAVLVRAESVEGKWTREATDNTQGLGATASANSDSEGEDASAPRLTVAQKLQLQMSSPTSLPDGTTIPLPIGGRRRVLSASYPLAAWTPAQKRNLARATLLSKVGERNDSPLFATIGALVLGPPVVILAVAFFSGYVDFLG